MHSLKLSVSGLPATSSIESYVQYANSIPLLTREQEQELAQDWYHNKNVQAAQALILSHLRYVVRISKNYMGYGLNLADLIQEGTIGLMKAVKKFEPNKEVRLVTFAMHWIKAEIHEFIVKNWKIVKIATTKGQRKLFFKLRSKKKGLEWLSQSEIKEIASDLGVKEYEVAHMEARMYSSDLAFDVPADRDDNESASMSPIEYLTDNSMMNPEDILASNESKGNAKQDLESALEVLDDREKRIIKARWLNGNQPRATLAFLSNELSVSTERVRQIEAKAMQRIRQAIIDESETADNYN
jgi:RNA polymerase sigma-32 factor